MTTPLIEWPRNACDEHEIEPIAVFRRAGAHAWPLVASDEDDLARQLESGGHFLPLPTEPAALANVIEVSIVSFLCRRIAETPGASARRGTERGYPDLEISGGAFGEGFHAVDIKVARRAKNGKTTNSRITLYTGNTFFAYPQLHWPNTFRPFSEYSSHVDVLVIYTLNDKSLARVEDIEIIVQEPWRIASTQRSSTTREYLGAVMSLQQLRDGKGEFESPESFYKFWRAYRFKVGQAVKQQLNRMLKEQERH